LRNSLKHKIKTPKLGVKVGCGYFLMMMENMDVDRQGSALSKFVYLFIFRGGQYVPQVSMLFINNNWFLCKNVSTVANA
jgi:hypothetical protein